MKTRRDVSLLILYDEKKRILLQHREKDIKILPDYWGFFGGQIEKNETPLQAVKREANEELEYIPAKPKLILTQKYLHPEKEKEYFGKKFVFLSQYDESQKLELREGQGMGWYKIFETNKLKIIDHDREVLKIIEKYL